VSYIGAEPTTAAFPFDQFSGNGTTTAFTLTYAPASTTSIIVAISGVVQNPNLYSVIGTTITFSPAPPTGTNNISVLYLGLPVQIGTPIPGSRLELALGSAANPSLTFLGDTNTGIFSPAADTIAIGTGGTEAIRVDSSRNMMVGTSSITSGAKFQVDNPNANVILSVGKDIPVSLFSRYNDEPALYWKSGQVLRFAHTTDGVATTGFTERMRIDSSGNLLVGTTSVYDNSRFTLETSSAQPNGIAVKTFGNNNALAFWRNSTTYAGAITLSGSGTAYSSASDYRLKNTIAPMTGALAKVALLKPVTYKWNADGSDGQGFIAHELQAVVPDCVTGEKDAVDADGNPVYQGIDTSFLVATLTAAIQELKAELDATKAEVALLKGAA
jgi:hypothetical protein